MFIGYKAGYTETGSNKLYISNEANQDLITGDFTDDEATPVGTQGAGMLKLHAIAIFMPYLPMADNGANLEVGQLYVENGSGTLKIANWHAL